MPKLKILILYGWTGSPIRASIRDLLFCYQKYAKNAYCFYADISFGIFPKYLYEIEFDIIIYHTILLCSAQWGGRSYLDLILKTIQPLQHQKAVKIFLPQDEWLRTDFLNEFINKANIDIVFSVAPPTEWKTIYSKVDFSKVQFRQVLTGYLDEVLEKNIKNYEKQIPQRNIDIGYRANRSPAWLGKHGFLKTQIAEIFEQKCPKNFRLDISIHEKDKILGDNWYKFLLTCRYTIGVEGGSTVHDPDGSIWEKGIAFAKNNPDASFEEIEKAVFPNMDGNLQLIAISPRHLEACLTRTCQILIEGTYNGILEANKHYIPLKADFSNLDEVFEKMQDENLRKQIVNQCYKDIVLSKKYSYHQFVNYILEESLKIKKISTKNSFKNILTYYYWSIPKEIRQKVDWWIWNIKHYGIVLIKRFLFLKR